jgi:guanine nucleotide-binding protein alpha-1 subunit
VFKLHLGIGLILLTIAIYERDRAAWRIVVQLNLVRSINLILEILARKLSDKQQDDASLRLTNAHHLLNLRLSPLKHVEQQLCQRLGASSLEESPSLYPASVDVTSSRGSNARSGELFVRDHSSWKCVPHIQRSGSRIGQDEDQIMMVISGCRDDMKALWTDPVSRQLIQNRDLRLQESAEL